ncbi:MAG: ribokinase [Mycobacteriales bacterium]
MSVVVFGSANMDIIVRSPRFPAAGETIIGSSVHTMPGGKGANQAVAAARLGCRTAFVGRVGADAFGSELRRSLADAGVDVSGLRTDSRSETGIACIVVDDTAENRIIIVAGANDAVGGDDLDWLRIELHRSRILLVQLELRLDLVAEAVRAAAAEDVRVIADPAPAPLEPLPKEFFQPHVVLTPNETEIEALVGYSVATDESACRAAVELTARGTGAVAVKLGARGVCWSTGDVAEIVRPPAVVAVDSVGAGDAVNGALAAALTEDLPFRTAVRWAVAAGALAVTRPGAQPAMPNRQEVLACVSEMDQTTARDSRP